MIVLKQNTKYYDLSKARSHKYIERHSDGKGGWIYTYSKKMNGNNNVLNYQDMRDFGYEKALQISKDTELIRNKQEEHMIVCDNNGNKFFSKIGTTSDVTLTSEEQELIKNTKLIIHNHPNNLNFSDRDFNLLLKLNIQEIRACGHKHNLNTNFSIKKITITDEQRLDFLNNYLKDVTYMHTHLKQQNYLGLLSYQQANDLFYQKSIELFHKYNKGYYEHGKF